MVQEFDLPMEIIDRKVTKMKMISPSNREVDVGKTLSEREWIGMCRREIFDDFLRKRAEKNGAKVRPAHRVRAAPRGAHMQLHSCAPCPQCSSTVPAFLHPALAPAYSDGTLHVGCPFAGCPKMHTCICTHFPNRSSTA